MEACESDETLLLDGLSKVCNIFWCPVTKALTGVMPDFVTLFICCFVILIYITVPHNICCGQNTHCSTLLRIYGIKSRISQNLVWFGGGIVKSGNGMPTMNIHTHTKKFWFHMGTETSLYVFFNLWLAFISAFYTHRIKKNIL